MDTTCSQDTPNVASRDTYVSRGLQQPPTAKENTMKTRKQSLILGIVTIGAALVLGSTGCQRSADKGTNPSSSSDSTTSGSSNGSTSTSPSSGGGSGTSSGSGSGTTSGSGSGTSGSSSSQTPSK